jgi:DNA polymerase-1
MGGIISKDEEVLACIKVQAEIDPPVTEIEDLEIQASMGIAPEGWEGRIQVIKAALGIRPARADFHRRSAAGAYKITPEAVTGDQRQTIKSAISFGLYYGRMARALGADMGWTVDQAQEFVDGFWKTYHGVYGRHQREVAFARKNGYVTTITGRRRRLLAINSPDRGKRGHAERQAMNTGIQGPCSDFTLLSGIALDKAYRAEGMRSRVVALVHDAVYTDAPSEEVLKAARLKKGIMEAIPNLFPEMIAPLFVERRVGVTMGKD